MNNNTTKSPQPLNRLVTLRWFDTSADPDETLALLLERLRNRHADGMLRPVSMMTFVSGNAVDLKVTSFHGSIDLDQDLYPVLIDARSTQQQIFSRAVFSLEDMGMDSGEKLFYLRSYIHFVQHTWALPGHYIGLSTHVVREIANLAYWKNWTLEFRLDQHDSLLVITARFPARQDMDFVIEVLHNNDPVVDPSPRMQEWLRCFRSIVKEAAELWNIRIVVSKMIAGKLGCLDDNDVIITKVQLPPYPCQWK
jgi:hypothetical protein